MPLTLRLAFRQREASWERLTDFAGSFRSWMSASERVLSGGIVSRARIRVGGERSVVVWQCI